MYIYWLIIEIRQKEKFPNSQINKLSKGFIVLLVIQIIYGAFTAGLKAGYLLPKGTGITDSLFGYTLRNSSDFNLLNNGFDIQTFHRLFAWFVFFFAILPDKRLIYYVYPFLIIFATISLQRFGEYGLSTFSFNEKQKKLCIVGIMCFVLILSGLYTLGFEVSDPILNNEEILFAETLENKFDGKILDAGYTLKGMHYVHVTDPLGVFKNYKISQDPGAYYLFEFNSENINLMPTKLYAKSLEDFIEVSYEYELNYISINKNGVSDIFYPYLNEIYENEAKFPYLIKVFDTEREGFEKLKAKVFEIDYKIYHELNG